MRLQISVTFIVQKAIFGFQVGKDLRQIGAGMGATEDRQEWRGIVSEANTIFGLRGHRNNLKYFCLKPQPKRTPVFFWISYSSLNVDYQNNVNYRLRHL